MCRYGIQVTSGVLMSFRYYLVWADVTVVSAALAYPVSSVCSTIKRAQWESINILRAMCNAPSCDCHGQFAMRLIRDASCRCAMQLRWGFWICQPAWPLPGPAVQERALYSMYTYKVTLAALYSDCLWMSAGTLLTRILACSASCCCSPCFCPHACALWQ